MVKFTTVNVDGKEELREFDSIEEILKNWWSDEGTDLPEDTDRLIRVSIDGHTDSQLEYLKKFNFGAFIDKLSTEYWNTL